MKHIKSVVFLNRYGDLAEEFYKLGKKGLFNSRETYPVVVENYLWDLDKQEESAEKYKDQIKRVFYQDSVEKKIKVMLQDDVQRLKLVSGFTYNKTVLEVGCSDGTVSIKIAQNPSVKKVLGIDIRKSAIIDGRKLLKDLVKTGEIQASVARKVLLENKTIESLPLGYGKFDSVCAYEVFEHMAPQDLLPGFQHLYRFVKKNGKFFISVPNRFPHPKYEKEGRSRWKWFDHRNFFSQASLKMFLENFFGDVRFHSLYPKEKVHEGIYLICECSNKLYD